MALVAARRRKDERVEDDVVLGDSVRLRQDLVAATRDLDLAFAGEGLRLLGVLVDRPEDDRCAVAAQQRSDRFDPLLAVLEVDRVHDRFALAVGQRDLHGAGVGRVDHDRRLHRAAEAIVELAHRGHLVALGRLQAHIDDLGAALDLATGDLHRLVPLPGRHHFAKLLRADDVGAFADQQRAVVVVGLHEIDSGEDRPARRRHVEGSRPPSLDHSGERRGVGIGGAAAAADDIEPPGVREPRER